MIIINNLGQPIDLSLGIAFKDDKVPGTFFKRYINCPKIEPIIDNIKHGHLCALYFFEEGQNNEVSCKFCGSDKFYVKQGAWFAVLVCPECRYEIQWES